MPNLTISHSNSSTVFTPEIATRDSMSSAVPVLQGLLEGLGWQDQRAEIHEQDQKAHTIAQAVEQAFADYQTTPTASTQAKLVATLTQELKAVSDEYEYLLKQQQHYQTQAGQERATTDSSTYYSWYSWGEWLINGAKQFFGSTAAQQAEKYAELTQSRQQQIHQLHAALAHLTEEVLEETASLTVDDLELTEATSIREDVLQDSPQPTSSQHSDISHPTPRATVSSQPHARRLLQHAMSEEFLVNAYTLKAQGNANIQALVNGDFVVAWQSEGQDGSGEGIYAKRYTSAGMALGDEFQVNREGVGDQEHTVVTALPNNEFVIAWMSMGSGAMNMSGSMDDSMTGGGQSSNVSALYAQRYSATGTPVGDPFQVNAPEYRPMGHEEEHFSMRRLTTGDLLVAWQSGEEDIDVYVQRYSLEGVALGNAFRANTYTLRDQEHPYIGALDQGDSVITWSSGGQDGSGDGIYARRFSSLGAPLGEEFQVNSYTVDDQKRPAVAVLTNGDFVITWSSYGQDGRGEGAYARRYNATGVALGDEFQINTDTLGDQEHVTVAALTGGGFVFAWMNTDNGDGMGHSMNDSMTGEQPGNLSMTYMAKRYSSAGISVGDEFQVNSHPLPSSSISSVSVSGLAEDDFAVVWTGEDSGQEGVYARIFPTPAEHKGMEGTLSPGAVTAIIAATVATPILLAFLGYWGCNKYKQLKAIKTLTSEEGEKKEFKDGQSLSSQGGSAPPGHPTEQKLSFQTSPLQQSREPTEETKETKATKTPTHQEIEMKEIKEGALLISQGMFAPLPEHPTAQEFSPQTSPLKQSQGTEEETTDSVTITLAPKEIEKGSGLLGQGMFAQPSAHSAEQELTSTLKQPEKTPASLTIYPAAKS